MPLTRKMQTDRQDAMTRQENVAMRETLNELLTGVRTVPFTVGDWEEKTGLPFREFSHDTLRGTVTIRGSIARTPAEVRMIMAPLIR